MLQKQQGHTAHLACESYQICDELLVAMELPPFLRIWLRSAKRPHIVRMAAYTFVIEVGENCNLQQ